MAQSYIGEIRMVGFNFAPANWALCNGQLLAISQNNALFALLGTTYGGDGVNTFALPDLRGRIPIHQGTGAGLGTYVQGQIAGTENVTLLTMQLPSHNHLLNAGVAGGTPSSSPINNTLGGGELDAYVASALVPAVLDASSIPPGGGGNQPHNNIQPYLCVNFVISLFGVFPSRN